MKLSKFDVVEVHMGGDENLKAMSFYGFVLDDRRGDAGTGLVKVLAITKEPTALTIGIWNDGLNVIMPRPDFKAALINDGGYASQLTDVAQWEF